MFILEVLNSLFPTLPHKILILYQIVDEWKTAARPIGTAAIFVGYVTDWTVTDFLNNEIKNKLEDIKWQFFDYLTYLLLP